MRIDSKHFVTHHFQVHRFSSQKMSSLACIISRCRLQDADAKLKYSILLEVQCFIYKVGLLQTQKKIKLLIYLGEGKRIACIITPKSEVCLDSWSLGYEKRTLDHTNERNT